MPMLKDWLSFLLLPSLDWIQVEVSSYCNVACVYCPRTVYRDVWLNRYLPSETFKRLLPAFAKTRLVFLQGWGEPFFHPDFLAMAVMAKEAGCRVGTTNNGMLLNPEMARKLVECGMDVVAFSLAGVDEKNDVVRRETSMGKVLDATRTLHQAKERLGSTQPAIHIAYMLLRSRIRDVENLPLSLRGLGISQVVISPLDFALQRTRRRGDNSFYPGRVSRTPGSVGFGESRG
jgi:sulfatase maturation enzyme AslB (radical SAM superfamily)